MTEPLTIIIPGIPQPQGSKSVGKYGQLYESNSKLAAWRDRAVIETKRCKEPFWPIMDAVQVNVVFVLPRPKTDYGTGKNAKKVRPNAPRWNQHRKKPDLDKLLRAVGDALTLAGLWYDDAQASKIVAQKVYGDDPQTVIKIGSVS